MDEMKRTNKHAAYIERNLDGITGLDPAHYRSIEGGKSAVLENHPHQEIGEDYQQNRAGTEIENMSKVYRFRV